MALPLLEVFSVAIFPKSLPFPLEVYGEIFVYEKEDPAKKYYLYMRKSKNPEVIFHDGQLLLLTHGPVCPMKEPAIYVVLLDKVHHAIIAKGSLPLDNATSDDYEEVKNCLFHGDIGYARVNYIALACALVAQVKFRFKSSDKTAVSSTFGSIRARYGKTYGKSDGPVTGADALSSTLVNILPDEATALDVYHLENDPFLWLPKKVVAVPAYSSLIIEADLKDRRSKEPFFKGTYTFIASPRFCYSSVYFGQETCSYSTPSADLFVTWHDLTMLFPWTRKERLPLEKSLVCWSLEPALMEVFSVFIGRENNADLSVCGTISVLQDNFNFKSVNIFERDDKNPYRLLNGQKLLPITAPSVFLITASRFLIAVELKDVSSNGGSLLISEGEICYNEEYLHAVYDSPFDKLLCYVVQGHQGYCAVHLTVFNRAVRMNLTCDLLCKGIIVPSKVYGRIEAWYGMFDYTSEYNRKYYRRVLFNKSEHDEDDFTRRVVPKNAEEESCSSNTPTRAMLFNSNVAMPVYRNCPLVISVDLHVSSHSGRGPAEKLMKNLEYNLGGPTPLVIPGDDFDIAFNVDFIR